MDLLSLPDEMLASVLKFSKFETLLRLRKTNVRINKVSIRYGINKPKCFVIEAEKSKLTLRVKFKKIDMEENPPSPYTNQLEYIYKCADYITLLESTLKKVRSVQVIWIDRLDVDVRWLDLLDSLKRRHRTEVSLLKCNYKVSLEDLKQVLGKFKSVKFLMSTENVINRERVVTDKAVCSILSFAELIIEPSETEKRLPAITDKTLKMLQTDLPKEFYIHGHCAKFSLTEVIETFKVGIMNPCKPPRYWNLGKVKVNSIEELNEAFNEFSSIEGIRITDDRSNYRRMQAWFKQGISGYRVTIGM